ncbi:BA75_01567T0 [Komagataella pastoris]|uniref:BA75_01567T0 n=1 Tax=Komagataella pastoris TaxID=4922 RepID=A0A1B2J6Q9_PICPA|nr:BA75_01567T0 [Komagataella pastoris]
MHSCVKIVKAIISIYTASSYFPMTELQSDHQLAQFVLICYPLLRFISIFFILALGLKKTLRSPKLDPLVVRSHLPANQFTSLQQTISASWATDNYILCAPLLGLSLELGNLAKLELLVKQSFICI